MKTSFAPQPSRKISALFSVTVRWVGNWRGNWGPLDTQDNTHPHKAVQKINSDMTDVSCDGRSLSKGTSVVEECQEDISRGETLAVGVLAGSSQWMYPPEIKHRYQKWPYLKGTTFSKPSTHDLGFNPKAFLPNFFGGARTPVATHICTTSQR